MLEDPVEEEEDLLDLAYGLTHTSRLGCQVKVTKEMENMIVKLPSATRNFYVDKKKEWFGVYWIASLVWKYLEYDLFYD